MIYFNDINLMSNELLKDQIDRLTEGKYYLDQASKFEEQRRKLKERFYNGKITTKEYSDKAKILIENVLSNIDKVYISENLPF